MHTSTIKGANHIADAYPVFGAEPLVERVAHCKLQTQWAEFEMHGFADLRTGQEHVALTLGSPGPDRPVLARLHSECLTGDALTSCRCDCGAQLRTSLRRIAKCGTGVLLYLRQEGRSIGLLNKLRAYELQDAGLDTVRANHQLGFAADQRDYSVGVAMLLELGINCVELMTNNPDKVRALEMLGIPVARRVPIKVGQSVHNRRYLRTKADLLGHYL